MSRMTKKRPTPQPSPDPGSDEPKKRPPSREKTRYIALPKALHEALARYAKDHSDEDEDRSISWAGRKAVRDFLQREGYWPPPNEEVPPPG